MNYKGSTRPNLEAKFTNVVIFVEVDCSALILSKRPNLRYLASTRPNLEAKFLIIVIFVEVDCSALTYPRGQI